MLSVLLEFSILSFGQTRQSESFFIILFSIIILLIILQFFLQKSPRTNLLPFHYLITSYTVQKINLMTDNQLPPNIRSFIKQNQMRMLGNKIAVTKFMMSLKDFEGSRINSKELARIRIENHRFKDNIQSNQIFHILIQGRKNTYYEGKIIPFFMFVFDQYPLQPPQIIAPQLFSEKMENFVQFLHLNIDNNGHVCMLLNQKDKQYYGQTVLKELLLELQKTIYDPNILSAYQNPLIDAYKSRQESDTYNTILNEQAKLLPNNDLYQEDGQSSDQDSDSSDNSD